ncbi:unnamed protein product [Closterium sp. Naga37s-1]|nr:unnamed protein product [Closterium sp. Naga37s-1]
MLLLLICTYSPSFPSISLPPHRPTSPRTHRAASPAGRRAIAPRTAHRATSAHSSHAYYPSFYPSPLPPQTNQPSNPPRCFTCGQEGHRSTDCPDRQRQHHSQVVCFGCKQPGHLHKHCPNRPAMPAKPSGVPSGSGVILDSAAGGMIPGAAAGMHEAAASGVKCFGGTCCCDSTPLISRLCFHSSMLVQELVRISMRSRAAQVYGQGGMAVSNIQQAPPTAGAGAGAGAGGGGAGAGAMGAVVSGPGFTLGTVAPPPAPAPVAPAVTAPAGGGSAVYGAAGSGGYGGGGVSGPGMQGMQGSGMAAAAAAAAARGEQLILVSASDGRLVGQDGVTLPQGGGMQQGGMQGGMQQGGIQGGMQQGGMQGGVQGIQQDRVQQGRVEQGGMQQGGMQQGGMQGGVQQGGMQQGGMQQAGMQQGGMQQGGMQQGGMQGGVQGMQQGRIQGMQQGGVQGGRLQQGGQQGMQQQGGMPLQAETGGQQIFVVGQDGMLTQQAVRLSGQPVGQQQPLQLQQQQQQQQQPPQQQHTGISGEMSGVLQQYEPVRVYGEVGGSYGATAAGGRVEGLRSQGTYGTTANTPAPGGYGGSAPYSGGATTGDSSLSTPPWLATAPVSNQNAPPLPPGPPPTYDTRIDTRVDPRGAPAGGGLPGQLYAGNRNTEPFMNTRLPCKSTRARVWRVYGEQ